MFWLACVATAQAPTLSDRVDALEAIVQKLESTVHEQRLTISSLQRALVSNTPSSTDAWPATAPRHRRQLSGTTTMLELKPDVEIAKARGISAPTAGELVLAYRRCPVQLGQYSARGHARVGR